MDQEQSSPSDSSESSLTSSSESQVEETQPISQLLFRMDWGSEVALFGNNFECIYEVENQNLVLKQKNAIDFRFAEVFGVGFPAFEVDGGFFGLYQRHLWSLRPFEQVMKLKEHVRPFSAALFGGGIAFLADGVLYQLNVQQRKASKCVFQPPNKFRNACAICSFESSLVFIPCFGGCIGVLCGSDFKEEQILPGFSAEVVNVFHDIVVLKIDHQETALLSLKTLGLTRAGRLVHELECSYLISGNVVFGDNQTANFDDLLTEFK